MKTVVRNVIIYILSLALICVVVIGYVTHLENPVLKDDAEIERKWIIDKNDIPFDFSEAEKYDIVQTYISFSPEIRLRKINEDIYVLTTKYDTRQEGLVRTEHEYRITKEEYEKLLNKKEANTIYKRRYAFKESGLGLEIDIFDAGLEGLAYLEIEFENEKKANEYIPPDWVIKEVTGDEEYKNGSLARYGIPKSYYEYVK